MPIEVHCNCGKKLRAPDSAAGRRARCPACGSVMTLPSPVTEVLPTISEDIPFAARYDDTANSMSHQAGHELGHLDSSFGETGEIPVAPVEPVRSAKSVREIPHSTVGAGLSHAVGIGAVAGHKTFAQQKNVSPDPELKPEKAGGYLYFILLLVLIPLGISMFKSDHDSVKDRYQKTVLDHPEVISKLENLSEEASMGDVLDVFPDQKLEGAVLSHNTYAHWIMAIVSGAAFIGLVLLVFPRGHAEIPHLIGVGIFTGTIGILLLLVLQWLAFHMPWFRGGGKLALLLLLIKLIGVSYSMALGDHGFFVSFLGFTAGVGFCEEACKAIPLIYIAKKTGYLNWRTAMIWGLISGVGFGASEGVTYSADYYNGIASSSLIYYVRFISCVGLHAMWAAAVGIVIYKMQDAFRGDGGFFELLLRTIQAVIVPMILHGLYDTLLKQHFDIWALVVGVVSFAWLAFQIEYSKRKIDPALA